MLKRCSDKQDMTEWNEWREEHPNEDIWLQRGNFRGWFLKGIHLNSGESIDVDSHTYGFTGKIHLEGADLFATNLEGAYLWEAHLESVNFAVSNIKRTNFDKAFLQKANFFQAIVDGETSVWQCKVNQYNSKNWGTHFSGVGLDSIRIDPATKQLLEYNIRRKNWEEWYKEHAKLKWVVKPFWWVSDYGLSTGRIIACFFILAIFFAAIYSNFSYWYPPGIVSNLEVEPHLPIWHYFFLLLIRPIYLSTVTMTIGFGNMDANAQSILGHILIGLQVILGYVLLAALVTRFAVLFTAGGPAGKFADEKEKTSKIS